MMRFGDSHPSLQKYLAVAGLAFMVAFDAHAGIATTRSSQDPNRKPPADAVTKPPEDAETMDQLRKRIRRLAAEVEKLAQRIGNLEKERLFDVTRVLLVGEEQRAEGLQARLRENLERQLAVQARMDQVDNQLKPENIERMFIGVGLVRPEEARDNVRRRLGLEKQGLLAQLELLRQERNRFQSSLATADIAIQRFRLRLAGAGRP